MLVSEIEHLYVFILFDFFREDTKEDVFVHQVSI